jgi:hypothetical protein
MTEDSSTYNETLEPEQSGPSLLALALAGIGFIVIGIAVGVALKQLYMTSRTSKPGPVYVKRGQRELAGVLNTKQADKVAKKVPTKSPTLADPKGARNEKPSPKNDEPNYPAIPAPPRGSELRKS